MKTNCLLIALIAAILSSCGQGTPSATASDASTANTGNMDTSKKSAMNADTTKSDANFLTTVYTVGMFEMQAAQLAIKTSKNADIKKFAEMMITDHADINKEVSVLAQKENVTLPTDLSGDTKAEYTKLQGLSGADFDKEYIDANVKGHTDAVQLFDKEANGNGPQDTKALAQKYEPVIKKHLEHAEMVQKKLTNNTASGKM